jgi:hypothetical protein
MKYYFTQAIVASNPRHGMPKRKLRAYPITQNPNELAAPVSPVVVESW